MQEKTHTESQRHRDDLRLGLCPRPRKRANHRRLTGVRGMRWNPISKSSTFSTLLHGQTYDLQIKPPMLCVSVTLCETPLPACGWRVRGGSETVVKRHLRAVGVPVSSAGARKWVNSRTPGDLPRRRGCGRIRAFARRVCRVGEKQLPTNCRRPS